MNKQLQNYYNALEDLTKLFCKKMNLEQKLLETIKVNNHNGVCLKTNQELMDILKAKNIMSISMALTRLKKKGLIRTERKRQIVIQCQN